MIKINLYIVLIAILFACQKDIIVFPFIYESENFEVNSNIRFKYIQNTADSVRWVSSSNLTNTQSALPYFSNTNEKEASAIFYGSGQYNITLLVFKNGQKEEYTKKINILPATILEVYLYNQYNQTLTNNWNIAIYGTEKDAELLQNEMSSQRYFNNNSVIFYNLKSQRYFFRINALDCDTNSISTISSTTEPIILNIINSKSLIVNTPEVEVELINSRGDTKAKIYLCKSISCNSPSPDRKPDYIVEPASSSKIKLPLGFISYFYTFENGFGGFESVNVKCGETNKKVIGFN